MAWSNNLFRESGPRKKNNPVSHTGNKVDKNHKSGVFNAVAHSSGPSAEPITGQTSYYCYTSDPGVTSHSEESSC